MPVREVTDGDDCRWTVWDTYPQSSQVMDGYEAGWLTFECEGEKRRITPVPDGWADASELQLLGYLAAAKIVQRKAAKRGGP